MLVILTKFNALEFRIDYMHYAEKRKQFFRAPKTGIKHDKFNFIKFINVSTDKLKRREE